VIEAELKKHLDDAEKGPKQIAAAVLSLMEKTLSHKPSPDIKPTVSASPLWPHTLSDRSLGFSRWGATTFS
jgi:hypothetical protein